MVGRGKLPARGPQADGRTSWEAARGRGRHPELAARMARDHVKPLVELDSSAGLGGGGEGPPAAAAARAGRPVQRDHVRELIEAEPQPVAGAAVSPPRFHAHRAAVDHVGAIITPKGNNEP